MSINRIQPDTTLPKAAKVKIYTALISQTGTANPTIIVLNNTLGITLTWTRAAAGQYVANTGADEIFTLDKVWCDIENSGAFNSFCGIRRVGTSEIEILTGNQPSTGADNILNLTSLEIRIYE